MITLDEFKREIQITDDARHSGRFLELCQDLLLRLQLNPTVERDVVLDWLLRRMSDPIADRFSNLGWQPGDLYYYTMLHSLLIGNKGEYLTMLNRLRGV